MSWGKPEHSGAKAKAHEIVKQLRNGENVRLWKAVKTLRSIVKNLHPPIKGNFSPQPGLTITFGDGGVIKDFALLTDLSGGLGAKMKAPKEAFEAKLVVENPFTIEFDMTIIYSGTLDRPKRRISFAVSKERQTCSHFPWDDTRHYTIAGLQDSRVAASLSFRNSLVSHLDPEQITKTIWDGVTEFLPITQQLSNALQLATENRPVQLIKGRTRVSQ